MRLCKVAGHEYFTHVLKDLADTLTRAVQTNLVRLAGRVARQVPRSWQPRTCCPACCVKACPELLSLNSVAVLYHSWAASAPRRGADGRPAPALVLHALWRRRMAWRCAQGRAFGMAAASTAALDAATLCWSCR